MKKIIILIFVSLYVCFSLCFIVKQKTQINNLNTELLTCQVDYKEFISDYVKETLEIEAEIEYKDNQIENLEKELNLLKKN